MKNRQKQIKSKKGSVTSDLVWILIAGAVLIALMTILILWKIM